MKIFTNIMKVIYNTILAIIIVTVIALIILYAFGIHPYVVESGSMMPSVPVGGLCFVDKKVPYSEVTENDIIAFKSGAGMRVAHRVVSISDEGLDTKGDLNNEQDGERVKEGEYIGRTVFSIPRLGYVVKVIQTPYGLVCCGIVLIMYVLIGMLFENPEDKKKSNKKQSKKTNNSKEINNEVQEKETSKSEFEK